MGNSGQVDIFRTKINGENTSEKQDFSPSGLRATHWSTGIFAIFLICIRNDCHGLQKRGNSNPESPR